ncbi:SDR family NAD(P)-dependent oxidoreductase [Rubrobacter calidifluminis]|uniref:SDR family NAD(P)-dependent oxidoreductase n=1 Tax=Rubrobacter calidifluminis TaxID=1392640 RepID=UPI00235E56F6|nr:SDR family oxidoreductase [Rubrobacter calidifluminis]
MRLRPSAEFLARALGAAAGAAIKRSPSRRLSFAALGALSSLAAGERPARIPLRGMRVVITGASGGVGRATCEALRREGARVVGIDLSPGEGTIFGDVTSRESIEAAIEEAARSLGGIDILINNAGIGRGADAGDFPQEEAYKTLEVNLFGAWNTTAAALPHLLKSGGHVVNVSSGLAILNVPYAAPYAASKRALAAYSDALRLEYAGRITVSTIYPGYMKTPIHDVVESQNASLDGLVPEEPVSNAAEAVVSACKTRARDVFTSFTGRAGLALARHFPAQADAVVRSRFEKMLESRPLPSFVKNAP